MLPFDFFASCSSRFLSVAPLAVLSTPHTYYFSYTRTPPSPYYKCSHLLITAVITSRKVVYYRNIITLLIAPIRLFLKRPRVRSYRRRHYPCCCVSVH